jgi:hypothetical protein
MWAKNTRMLAVYPALNTNSATTSTLTTTGNTVVAAPAGAMQSDVIITSRDSPDNATGDSRLIGIERLENQQNLQ